MMNLKFRQQCSNNSIWGLNSLMIDCGYLAFEKLESTVYFDIQFSLRNIQYNKTVSLPLGTQKGE